MAKGYVGVSSEAAPLLVAMGWPKLRIDCLEVASTNARRAALQEGGYPVLLAVEVPHELVPGLSVSMAVDPLQLRAHAVLPDAPTALERLGFSETAGVGDVVNSLLQVLDESHKAIRSAIDVGQGGSAELPSAKMLRRTLREILGKDPDGDDEDAHNRARRKANRGLRKFFSKTKKHVMKNLDGLRKKAGVKKATKPRGPKRPAPDTRKRAKKSDWAPKGKKAEDKVKWSPAKKASTNLVVEGTLNGKKMTLKIMAGKSYRVAKTQEGVRVSRPGLRGVFIASPSSAGKL